MTSAHVVTPAPGTVPSLHKDVEGPPFRRLLVANRGEIAVRILRACRELGIETVAVYSDADAEAAHVRMADVAVRIGPAPAAESYLRSDRILAAADETRAEAIHPGYGFLSERASFAAAVEDAGLVWVGPPAGVIQAVGDKLAARRLAAAAGVAVVPGTLQPAPVDAEAAVGSLAEASRVGYPLLVKAAAGGGGRGMRRVERAGDLVAALVAGSAEAAAAFGDGAVYVEREVRPARHVEVQLIGERDGRIVALGERDCSIQRRHQKLVEEGPAPGLDPERRRELHAMAVQVAQAAGLHNAATAEFLLDADGRFWFLEVNTRLQVEHGVTELVADVDLVREQIRLAAGRPFSREAVDAAVKAPEPERHAIEVRLSAEDPSRAFAPTPGRIGRWVMPSGPGVRVDTAARAGEIVTADYDPLLAKLLVVAADRGRAIDRLRRALDEVEVTGLQTTLPFHHFVARHPGFRDGELSTDWVAENWDPDADRARALAVAAHVAASVAATAPPTEVSLRKDTREPDRGGWARSGRRGGVDRWPDR